MRGLTSCASRAVAVEPPPTSCGPRWLLFSFSRFYGVLHFGFRSFVFLTSRLAPSPGFQRPHGGSWLRGCVQFFHRLRFSFSFIAFAPPAASPLSRYRARAWLAVVLASTRQPVPLGAVVVLRLGSSLNPVPNLQVGPNPAQKNPNPIWYLVL